MSAKTTTDETTTTTRTEADALIETATKAVHAGMVKLDDLVHSVTITPTLEGHRVLDLDAYLPAPRRKSGKVTLHDAASFVAYVARHKNEGTVLYASVKANTVTAVLNDHDEAHAGWGDHRAVLELAPTEEWTRWTSQDGKLLTQGAFAEHIEQGLGEISSPPAAEMLELAQHFEAHSRVAFKSAQLLADGSRQLLYEETIDAKAGQKGQIKIPREFTLGMAPYEGSDAYRVVARLRYRLNGEALAIGYQLLRPADVLKAAFGDVLEAIADGTGIKPLAGVYGGR